MISLKTRLHLGLSASLMLFFLLLWWPIHQGITHFVEAEMLERMEQDAETLLSMLDFSGQKLAFRSEFSESHIHHAGWLRIFSGHYYQIESPGKTGMTSRSLWDTTLPIHTLNVGEAQISRATGPEDQDLLLWSGAFHFHKHAITITIAEDRTLLQQHLREFLFYYALVLAIFLLILLAIQHQIISRSLQPLRKAKEQIHALEQGEITRIDETVPHEILPLVQELNHALELLAQRLQRSRNALGNLAHELKRPLNLIIQLASEEKLQQQLPQLATPLQEQSHTLHRLLDRELKRARLAGGGIPTTQRFRVSAEMPSLIELLQRIHHQKPLKIDWTTQTDQPESIARDVLPIDRDDLLELLGNLLDNACKWAKTTVQCTFLFSSQNAIQISIEDDGAECSAEQMESLSKRGLKMDETVEGHGLGLSIVNEIVSLYGGTLQFEQSKKLGGLTVHISLPLNTGS